jgi:hypothetical protein
MKSSATVACIFGALTVLTLVFWAPLAAAGEDSTCHGAGYPWGWSPLSYYYGDYVRLYSSSRIPVPPYFALHPPVYYSYPVPRPYGYSPYAYPPGTKTPELAPPRPAVILNDYAPRSQPVRQKEGRIASAPVRIANPYAAGPGRPGRPVEGTLAADR